MQAVRALAFLAAALFVSTVAQAQCSLEWSPDFGRPAFTDAPSPTCVASASIGGGGPALYVGGEFTQIGGVTTNAIGKWDQSDWTALGGGLSAGASVYAIAAFDDDAAGPHPPVLIAGGAFTGAGTSNATNIAMWDGSTWTAMGTAPTSTDGIVYALTAFDDGTGPALYAAGNFNNMSGVAAAGVARWKNGAWSPLGSGIPVFGGFAYVKCLYGFNDGNGPGLFAGGVFNSAGGQSVNSLAVWRGGAWHALPNGPNNGIGNGLLVNALTSFNDGTGSRLYAAGQFEFAGGVTVNNIARWNGAQWSAVGAGVPGFAASIAALTVFNAGSGPVLYAGGFFFTAGSVPASHIARWNGASWSAVGGGADLSVLSMCVHNRGDGDALYTCGTFSYVNGGSGDPGGVAAKFLARWTGSTWWGLGNGFQPIFATGFAPLPMVVHSFGSGPELYIGGDFARAGERPANYAARWNGHRWMNQGEGPPHASGTDVRGIASYAGKLHYAGHFSSSTFDYGLAVWDGTNWTLPPSPWRFGSAIGSSTVLGSKLYFAGYGGFPIAAGVYAWDGLNWDLTYSEAPAASSYISAFLGVVDSQGPAIYLSHWHNPSVRKFDGSTTTAVGVPPTGSGFALAQFNDGTGSAIYAGGAFNTGGGAPFFGIAKWNGASWSTVGGGVDGICYALAVFDDGSGPALYAGGRFSHAGGVPANNIARWNGASWSALGAGILADGVGEVDGLVPYNDGSGPALYASGHFKSAGGFGSMNFACWRDTHRAPAILANPSPVTAAVGATVSFSVQVTPGNLQYHWRRFNATLANGPTGSGSTILGADSPQLTILDVGPADAGVYDCVITNACGSVTSIGALLTLNAPAPCYANCDNSTAPPVLNVNDFSCFLNAYAAGDPYANCDGSTAPPILNVNDFSCFLNKYAAGCP